MSHIIQIFHFSKNFFFEFSNTISATILKIFWGSYINESTRLDALSAQCSQKSKTDSKKNNFEVEHSSYYNRA